MTEARLAEAMIAPESPVPDVAVPTDSQCRRLMRAVLTEALEEVRKHRRSRLPSRQELVAETRAWFHSADTSWPFAFASICDTLGLDPDAVRSRLDAEHYVSPETLRRARYGHRKPRIVRRVAVAA